MLQGIEMKLYKYRGFTNLEFALDIFVNQRLYAADFQSLNDPLEGRFIYSKGSLDRNDLRKIRGEKSEYKLVSLSETPNNMLMWSYYSEGHKGFVVGVELADNQADIEKVVYVENLNLDNTHDNPAKSILTKKLELWAHEKEHRAFKRNASFVSVKVKELIFGLYVDNGQKELVTNISKKFCPKIKVRQITRQELETGKVDTYDI